METMTQIKDTAIAPGYVMIPSSPVMYLIDEAVTYWSKGLYPPTTKSGCKLCNRNKHLVVKTDHQDRLLLRQTSGKKDEDLKVAVPWMNVQEGILVQRLFLFLGMAYLHQKDLPVMGFSLQELVRYGMNVDERSARRSLQKAFPLVQRILFGGSQPMHFRKTASQKAGAMFSDMDIRNSYVRIQLGDSVSKDFTAGYTAFFPKYGFRLSANAFRLCLYIHRQLRTTKEENIRIRIDRICHLLALPTREFCDECGRKYRPSEQIKLPILNAIDEIRQCARDSGNADLELICDIPGSGPAALEKWIAEGRLQVVARGTLQKKLIEIREAKAERIERQGQFRVHTAKPSGTRGTQNGTEGTTCRTGTA